MKMGTEEQKLWEQAEMELEQEAEETSPLVRKSRNGDDSNFLEIPDVDGEVSNGVQSETAENGAQDEGLTTPAAEEQKIEDIDWLLGDESAPINGELEKREKSDLVLENKPEESTNGGHEIEEEANGVLENGSEAMNGNGEKSSENLVFHDKFEGIYEFCDNWLIKI